MAGFSQEQLDLLEEAIAKGVKIIKYRDKILEYRSLEEMLTLRSLIRKSLGLECTTGKKLISTNKGLGEC